MPTALAILIVVVLIPVIAALRLTARIDDYEERILGVRRS